MLQYQLYRLFHGEPGNKDTNMSIPYLKKAGKQITANYKAKSYIPNH